MINRFILISIALVYLSGASTGVLAGQGCPFDDGSCQEYCSQQGCNMGYCGHFAWIQCICRKCGDEWSWYDKVRYNPDKTVNQTELDSLKLNGTFTAPIIVTNSAPVVAAATPAVAQPVASKKPAQTLTTLLIPDLSETSSVKLDLNDIPDENSEKFLEYLAKNHEKLAAATNKNNALLRQQQQQQQQQVSTGDSDTNDSEEEDSTSSLDLESVAEQQQPVAEQQVPSTTQSSLNNNSSTDNDTVAEIQISTSNNNTRAPNTPAASAPLNSSPVASQTTRLLRVAVMQRNSEEIDD